MTKRLVVLWAIMAGIALLAGGCNRQGTPGAAPAATGSKARSGTLQSALSPDETYIVVNSINSIEYWNAAKMGWKKAGELFNVKTKWVGPQNSDTNAMVSALESAIAEKPAGICVFGWDPALATPINEATDAGIPVVTYNGDIPDSKRVTFVGSSNYDIGYIGGQKFADQIGGRGKVALLTVLGPEMFVQRDRGFSDAFAKYPGITMVAKGDTKADTNTAVTVAKNILAKNPDLAAFACTDSTGAMGAATALREMNLAGKVKIVGMDRNSDMLSMIDNGLITASITQDDAAMTYWAMVALITAKHYDAPLTSDNTAEKVSSMPVNIYTSINLATKENVKYFLEANSAYAAAMH